MIFERQLSTLHAKTAVFDGKFSIVGSYNLNGRSEVLDTEDVLAVEDPGLAHALGMRFVEGEREAHPVTLEELRATGVWTAMKQWGLHFLWWTF